MSTPDPEEYEDITEEEFDAMWEEAIPVNIRTSRQE